jgi:hypothetical protein
LNWFMWSKEVSMMASGRIKGRWHKLRNAMRVQGSPGPADPSMDTPERTAEKKQDAARVPPRYPGDNVPPGAWTGAGPV